MSITQSIAMAEVGGLEPPITHRRLDVIDGGLGGFSATRISIVRLVGDEIHFGLLPHRVNRYVVADGVTYPSAFGQAIFVAIQSFLSRGTRLSEMEDCAVEMGEIASKFFWNFFSKGIAIGALTASGQPFPIPGGQARLFPVPDNVDRIDFPSVAEMRFVLPMQTSGVCRLDSVGFPTQPIGLGVDFVGDVSLQWPPGSGTSLAATLNYSTSVRTRLNEGEVAECAALIGAATFGLGGVFWRLAFNSTIATQIVGIPQFSTFVRQLGGSWFYEFPVGSRPGGEGFQIFIPLSTNFGAIGSFTMDPQSIQMTRRGLSLRVAGRFPNELRDGATDSLPNRLEVRDQSESFPVIFSPVFSLGLGRDCTQAPSSIGFTLWNRSSRPVAVYQIDIISEDWWRIFRSGRVLWQPNPSPSSPIVIPPLGTTRISCEFASLQTLNDAVRLASTEGRYRELVILVLSDLLPLVVRWNDPLGRLRTQTPADIERAREACRLGPISSPWEIIRRPREFDLFPEFQPFWREDLSRVTPRDIQTQLPNNSLPWEGSSQLTLTEEARLDARPGVFALLMQSAARRR
jgi:hypothetical protein